MQIVDLRELPSSVPSGPPPVLEATAFYGEFGSAHNIAINEETGHAFVIGTTTCRGGLHMVDIRQPVEPVFLGCRSEEGYTHDTQAVVYSEAYPDKRFHNQEITFNYNEDSLAIVDVTDTANPLLLSKTSYDKAYYTHQGWLLKDGKHLLLNDELDEVEGPNPHTRTMIWNVEDLEHPKLVGNFYAQDKAIDHNLYIKGDLAYLSNYCAGLRVLDVSDINNVEEVAYFDVDPECDDTVFSGAWSSYVYFESGTIVVSSIERGLFVLKLAEDA
jgi:choice-of-anchor B domain-containing protein